MEEQRKIFVLYMLEDKEVLLNLSRRVCAADSNSSLVFLNDDPIQPGQKWIPKDESSLKTAHTFLFLISDAFMHSEFIKQIEFKNIIDSYREGGVNVIPVIIDDCPWNIDFNADDYTFTFKQLDVLPEGEKPLRNWTSIDEAYNHCATNLANIMLPPLDENEEEKPTADQEENIDAAKKEEQIAIDFAEEESKRVAEAEEKQRIEAKAAEERAAAVALRQKQEAEATRRVEEKLKQKEAEAQQKIEEQQRKRDETVAGHNVKMERDNRVEVEESNSEKGSSKRKALVGVLVAALLLAGIFLFSGKDGDSEVDQEAPLLEKKDVVVQEDSTPTKTKIVEANSKPSTLNAGAKIEKLDVGKRYEGGLIFQLDGDGNSGKIVHYDDAGPMTWSDAMKIHEQLGEGWRVPTFEELKLMYKTVGQGANNEGEFADDLYWSATPYDENQAKMVRFRDGNTSYHYNRRGTHRKYLVRAIRDFSR